MTNGSDGVWGFGREGAHVDVMQSSSPLADHGKTDDEKPSSKNIEKKRSYGRKGNKKGKGNNGGTRYFQMRRMK